jgi:H+-translocating NAD(P) transhydrogenase subunit beta
VDTVETVITYVFLAAATCFVLGLHLMNTPATARRGNLLSAGGMAAAVAGALVLIVDRGEVTATAWLVMIVAAAVGTVAGAQSARTVRMTAMPQLVSLFNAVGGGAAALLAIVHLLQAADVDLGARATVPGGLDIVIGSVAFTGSLVAAGKLQGWVTGAPVVFPGVRVITLALGLATTGGLVWLVAVPDSLPALLLLIAAALVLGVIAVLPIGGADMPVVISLLNAFTGIAVALAGFVLDQTVLIIAGALVGASGTILTVLMAQAMNRSVLAVMLGGFGTGGSGAAVAGGDPGARVRTVSADDVAIQLAYADKVIIVPGYGLAAARAQHEIATLAALLEQQGAAVSYAIHPVAGRMPGHMNVLLAEADVPYSQLKDLEEANPEFPQADVALVVGANDVTNPAARRPDTPVSGMPILDVDHARSVVVIKRSMGHGYAGIDNELYTNPRTGMLFADAKQGVTDLIAGVRALVR